MNHATDKNRIKLSTANQSLLLIDSDEIIVLGTLDVKEY